MEDGGMLQINSMSDHTSARFVNGPHGGTLVAIDSGYVEISVFETGMPPAFRLYFFDRDRKDVSPPQDAVTLETLRPGGASQLFTFRRGGDVEFRRESDFLQSTAEIPEPHEFEVKLNISHGDHAHTYRTKFTEDGHTHAPGDTGHAHGAKAHAPDGSHHDHAHDADGYHAHAAHDHDHAHGSGVLGWLRGLYGHSHSIAEKTDSVLESSERGIRALKISLVGLSLTAVLQLIVVFASGSVALLADTIHNFADAGTSIPLWIAFAFARKRASRRFTYGYGKLEDVAGVIIVLIIFASSCVAGYESIRKMIHPQPVVQLGWVAVAAVIGFLGNEAVAVFRIRVGREIGSAALVADGQHARVDGFTSLAVLIGVAGVWLGFPILDPIVGIAITIAILFIVKDAALSIWTRLIDGIEPEILAQIEHAPMHIEGVHAVHDVRARWIRHRVYSDVTINVDPAMSIEEADGISRKVEQAVRDHVPMLGNVVVRSRPAEGF